MTPQPTSRLQLRTLVIGGGAGIVLLAAIVAMQHFRHGWPFSLHHQLPAAQPTEVDHAAMTNMATENSPTPATQVRVPVELTEQQSQSIGIRLERVRRETISQPLRAVTTVVPDESRVTHVHARVAGWLESLYVNTTGQQVRMGEPLAAVFSQDLFATQQEYLSALHDAHAGPKSSVVEGAKTRLKLLGMSDVEIGDIEKRGEARRLVTLNAPHNGIVLHRGVSAGTAVDPSTELLTVADLSNVWVMAEVPESGTSQVKVGATASLEFSASGRAPINAKVDFLYPTLTERTRTVRARFSVPNPDGSLRPGLYGTATFQSAAHDALIISRDAVVDTGLSQYVYAATGSDRFEPRKVILGARLPDRVEVLQGLADGEEIVASGVFLLDSESRLRASGGAGTGHSGHGGKKAPDTDSSTHAAPPTEPTHNHDDTGAKSESQNHSGHGE